MQNLVKILLSVLSLTFVSCRFDAVRETRDILVAADSLRTKAEYVPDTLQMALAVRTLCPWKHVFPLDYAKANYYYGRALRKNECYAEAMSCFINAIRYSSKDAVLSGRIYTNMADICHLEGSYDLSYDLFGRAATFFYSACDTNAYCYALCDMAVEAVQKGATSIADSLLLVADGLTEDECVHSHIMLTKAMMYRQAKQYDSVIVCINSLQHSCCPPSGYVIKAQAFSFLGQKDSAVYYAQIAIEKSQSLFELNNMLYILSNDGGQDVETIRQLSAQRSDIQKRIETRQGELSRAVEILTRYLNKPYDWRWVFLLAGIVVLAGACLIMLRNRKRQENIRQDIVKQQNLRQQLSAEQRLRKESALVDFERNCEVLRASSDLCSELCWNDYGKMCEIVNRHLDFLAGKLKQTGVLNEKEVRLCVLVAIGVTYKQMAEMLPYALSGLSKFKYTTAKKLKVSVKDLRKKLIDLAIESGL